MKKILFIHHSGYIGGAGISLIHILDSVDKNKYSITVVCPSYPSDLSDVLKNKGYNVALISNGIPIFYHYSGGTSVFFSLTTVKNVASIIKSYKKIKNIIIDNKPDIVIVNSMTLCWVGKILKSLRIKSICFHRESYTRGLLGIRTRYIKYCLSEYFDRVAFISQYDYHQTGKTNSIKKVIYDRVDINNFGLEKKKVRSELNFEANFRYILYVGGLNKLKGLHVLLKALKHIKTENIKVVVLGYIVKNKIFEYPGFKSKVKYLMRANYEQKIVNYIRKNNLEKFLMLVSPTFEVEKYFVASDLVVFPSTKGHQARPIYESGIAKVPILLSDFPNTKEFVRDQENGYEFKKGNFLELSYTIDKIFRDKKKEDVIDSNYKRCVRFHNLGTLPLDLEELLN